MERSDKQDDVGIVTLVIDDESFRYLNDLRQAHFPAEKNFLNAHITLIHNLPLHFLLGFAWDRHLTGNAFPILFGKPYFLGKGTAITVESEILTKMHQGIKNDPAINKLLSNQDRALSRLHVTIQNKVDPKIAKEFFHHFSQHFEPFYGQGIGLDIWRYDGGPWSHRKRLQFLG